MATADVTFRDMELFTALERCPLTVRQIRVLSRTFRKTFGSDRRLQDRLAILTKADLLNRFRYATAEGSGRYYFTLTHESYRLLKGMDAALPSPGMFRAIGIARQHHTERLADFIVHTLVATQAAQVEVSSFFRENALPLTVEGDRLYPDCAFTLHIPNRPAFTYFVELDNSTEPLASPRERDSWLRKLQFYEKLQDQSDDRFRVLGVITKSPRRLGNLLGLAAAQARNPQRAVFYGIHLRDYLENPAPLFAPLFTDHRGLHTALLPDTSAPTSAEISPSVRSLAPAVAV